MARGVNRGDIWLYRFAPPDKRRPVLVISRDAALRNMHTALVAAITSTVRGLSSEVRLGPEHGLKNPSAVSLDHIYTVEKAELRQWVGSLSPAVMEEVCSALEVAVGCR